MQGNHGIQIVQSKQLKSVFKNYELYLFLVPALVLTFCFCYIPIYGVQIAFKNFSPARGIWASPWAGFSQFLRFFRTNQFKIVMSNTFYLSIYGIIVGFPLPIVLALMMNSMVTPRFKRVLQTITYMPYFISVVVLVSLVNIFLSPTGLAGHFTSFLGKTPQNFMAIPAVFGHTYVWSGVWQGIGWGSIIYLAALSAVDPTLYEAATIDGANKWQKLIHIDLPTIAPTCTILLILSAGGVLNVGFEKAFLMQNNLNLLRSEVINTYIYKVGIQSTQYSYSAAVGLFNNIINFAILATVNWVSGKLSETSLW
ncbi:MAG: ABC transporter permease subunit [Treponema sp.]|jgi:putative aldouronate transport system permease protein|nr:ABC transporter permease subunit [Treponema sp.]